MLDGYGPLLLATALFLALHTIPTRAAVRDRVVAMIGRNAYMGAFSLLSLGAIIWMSRAFGEAPYGPVLWQLHPVGPAIAVALMPLSLLLLVGGVSTANPTAAVTGDDVTKGGSATGVLRITRHPIMWSIGLWGIAHLLSNGELRAVILFGTLTALAIAGTYTIDRKARARDPAGFDGLAVQTSRLPFAAILAGRQSLGQAVRETGWLRLGITAALYAATLHLHAWAFGVYALPTTI